MTDVQAGERFGPYRIEAELGRGGMSIVYRAVEDSLSRTIALKIMASHLHDDTAYRQRFHVEARAAAAINHPNIVPIYAFGEQEARLYIAMQFVEGTDLREHIQTNGRLDPPAATAIIEQVAFALDAIHAKGMTHRDVKPDNILLGAPGRDGTPHVYVADFGLTRAEGDAHLTSTGQILGTMTYAAPEQLMGEPVDSRADVYALACVLFETVVGRPPFDKEVAAALIYAHMHEAPPAASTRRPDLPLSMDAVLLRGMAKSRDERYRTAGELVDAFRLASQQWAPAGAVDRAAGTVDAPRAAWLPPASETQAPVSGSTTPPVSAQAGAMTSAAPPPSAVPERPGKRKKRGCTVTISVALALGFVVLLGGGLAAVVGNSRRSNDVAVAPTTVTTAGRATTTAGQLPATVSSTVRRSTTTRASPTTQTTGGNAELDSVLKQMSVIVTEAAKARINSEQAVEGVLDGCRVAPTDARKVLDESIASRDTQLAELKKIDTSGTSEGAALATSLTTVLNQANSTDESYQRWLDDAVAGNPGTTPPGCPGGQVPKNISYTQAAAASSSSSTIRRTFVTLFNAQAAKVGVPSLGDDDL